MKKLSDFYDSESQSAIAIDGGFNRAFAAGVSQLVISERELEIFLIVHGQKLPHDADLVTKTFKYWGTEIIVDRNAEPS